MDGRQFAIRDRQNHWQGERAGSGKGEHGSPLVRSLLHAAGIAVAKEDPGCDAITAGHPWRSLPLVELFDTQAAGSRYCAITAVDDRGRVCDRTLLKVLGWGPGTPVTIATIPTVGVIVVRRGGSGAVTRQGHLRIPADARHGCRIGSGDRLLVVAHSAEHVLVAYTPYAIDAMTAAYYTSISTQDHA